MQIEIYDKMKFKSISATEIISGWNINNIQFNPMLTLLVGASGVGKTRILNLINGLCHVAHGQSFSGFKWKVEFEQNKHFYIWEGEFELKNVPKFILPDIKENKFAIKHEQIKDNNEILVSRSKDSIIYKGQKLVKLDNTKSIVELLKGEKDIKPIYDGFSQCYNLNMADNSIHVSPVVDVNKKNKLNINIIKASRIVSPLERLFLLKENNLKEFDLICHKFQDIFPAIEKIDFHPVYFNNTLIPVLKIKEKGVSSWILQDAISSGMMRTLLQIITLVLANDGDVITIDEFENGLGVNCINELADLIMEPEADIQVVMTSHHPYIINTIPVKDWKILTRNKCDVQAHTAEELHIGEHSKHEAFMQLMQTPEYKTGLTRN